MPASWAPVVVRDEAAVDDEVARRLVPLDELMKFCEVAVLLGLGVTAFDVAENVDVPESVGGPGAPSGGRPSRIPSPRISVEPC